MGTRGAVDVKDLVYRWHRRSVWERNPWRWPTRAKHPARQRGKREAKRYLTAWERQVGVLATGPFCAVCPCKRCGKWQCNNWLTRANSKNPYYGEVARGAPYLSWGGMCSACFRKDEEEKRQARRKAEREQSRIDNTNICPMCGELKHVPYVLRYGAMWEARREISMWLDHTCLAKRCMERAAHVTAWKPRNWTPTKRNFELYLMHEETRLIAITLGELIYEYQTQWPTGQYRADGSGNPRSDVRRDGRNQAGHLYANAGALDGARGECGT